MKCMISIFAKYILKMQRDIQRLCINIFLYMRIFSTITSNCYGYVFLFYHTFL